MKIIKEQPPYRVGQVVNLFVGHDDERDYYFPMEVTAIDGTGVTLTRRIDYDPAVMEFYFGKEAE